jgi:hypothetical protein
MRLAGRFSLLPLTCLVLAATAPVQAQSEVYKCLDEAGRVKYTNQPSDVRGNKTCKVVAGQISVVPASKPAAARPSGNSGPAEFPKVDSDTQRGRDDTRRKILQEELRTAEQELAKARQDLAEGEAMRNADERNYEKYLKRVQDLRDEVDRKQKNVDAIRQELSQK